MTAPVHEPSPRIAPNRLLIAAGVLQLATLLTPAARVRIGGGIPFSSLPKAGAALGILGALTIVVALLPRGWWRWIPGVLSLIVLAVTRWRIEHAPSATFADPAVRLLVRPSWGIGAMAIAIALGLVAAAIAPRPSSEAPRSR